MPSYLVRVKTNVSLDRGGLEALEDAVYDTVTREFGGSVEVDSEGIGITDVEAVYN